LPISYILDSSALLALLQREPGPDLVESVLDTTGMSAVNLCEVIGKLLAIPTDLFTAVETVRATGVEVIPFDHELACAAAALQPLTKALGLSLGDRACITLARSRNVPVLTTDRAWKKLSLKVGVDVRVIR